jgi:hypothetical protein
MRYVYICFLFISVRLYAQSDGLAAERSRALIALDEWSKVRRLFIEYNATPIQPFVGGGEKTAVRNVIAASYPNQLYISTSHFTDGKLWENDPMLHEYYINAGATRLRWAFSRSHTDGQLSAGDTIPGSIWASSIWLSLPYWPIPEYVLPPNSLVNLPATFIDFAKSPSTDVVGVEQAEGELCLVWSNNRGVKYWTAINKGHGIVRRIIIDPSSKLIIEEMRASQLTNIFENLWIPTVFEIEGFIVDRRTGKRSLARNTHIAFVRSRFNEDVQSDLFVPINEPGEIRVTEAAVEQVTPGGQDLLDKVVMYMNTSRYVTTSTKSIAGWWVAFAIALGGICSHLTRPSRPRGRQ